MKVRSLLFGMLCMLALGASLASCSDDDDDSLDDGGSKVTLPQARVYILNEGWLRELITQDLPFMHPIRMRISSVISTRPKTTPSWVTLVRV